MLDETTDRTALARRVPALEDNRDPAPLLLHGTLQFHQCDLQLFQVLFVLQLDQRLPYIDILGVEQVQQTLLGADRIEFLLAEHPELVDAEFVINEGGGGGMRDGVRLVNAVQAAEKVGVKQARAA